jgi:hypothetical protein
MESHRYLGGLSKGARQFKQVLIGPGGESSITWGNGDAPCFSFQGYSPCRRR